jgi:cytochrome c oxidase cbb3-type subunit 4
MDYELLMTFQGYAKFSLLFFVCVVFYSYAYSLYKRQKSGERDFEKYSLIVHNDSFDSNTLEKREFNNIKKGEI